MGNNEQGYFNDSEWEFVSGRNGRQVYQHKLNRHKLQRVELSFLDQDDYLTQKAIFGLRAKAGPNIAKVVGLWVKEDKFTCGQCVRGELVMPYRPTRLSDFKQLQEEKALYILSESIKGFKEVLTYCSKPFEIYPSLISVEEDDQVVVWLNQDYAKNQPSSSLPNLKATPLELQNRMVERLFSILRYYCVSRTFSAEFTQFKESRFQDTISCDDAVKLISDFARQNAVTLAQHKSKTNILGKQKKSAFESLFEERPSLKQGLKQILEEDQLPDPPQRISTGQVLTNATGRSQLVQSYPSEIRVFNPNNSLNYGQPKEIHPSKIFAPAIQPNFTTPAYPIPQSFPTMLPPSQSYPPIMQPQYQRLILPQPDIAANKHNFKTNQVNFRPQIIVNGPSIPMEGRSQKIRANIIPNPMQSFSPREMSIFSQKEVPSPSPRHIELPSQRYMPSLSPRNISNSPLPSPRQMPVIIQSPQVPNLSSNTLTILSPRNIVTTSTNAIPPQSLKIPTQYQIPYSPRMMPIHNPRDMASHSPREVPNPVPFPIPGLSKLSFGPTSPATQQNSITNINTTQTNIRQLTPLLLSNHDKPFYMQSLGLTKNQQKKRNPLQSQQSFLVPHSARQIKIEQVQSWTPSSARQINKTLVEPLKNQPKVQVQKLTPSPLKRIGYLPNRELIQAYNEAKPLFKISPENSIVDQSKVTALDPSTPSFQKQFGLIIDQSKPTQNEIKKQINKFKQELNSYYRSKSRPRNKKKIPQLQILEEEADNQ